MNCNNCNAEIPDDSEFCFKCGAKLHKEQRTEQRTEQLDEKTVANNLLELFRSTMSSSLFMAMCIAVTALAVLQFVSADIVDTLFAVFTAIPMWSLYVSATKSKLLYTYASPFKTLKTVVSISKILTWIAVVSCVVCGVLLLMFNSNFIDNDILGSYDFSDIWFLAVFASTDMMLTAIAISLFVIAALTVVINISFLNNILKCIASFQESVLVGGNEIKKVSAASKWLIVMAVFEIVTNLALYSTMNLLSLIISGGTVALYIMGNVWLKGFNKKLKENFTVDISKISAII